MLLVNLLAVISYHSIVTNSVTVGTGNQLTVLTIQCIDSNCDKLQMNITLNGKPSSFNLFENVDLFTHTYKATLESTDRTLSDSLQSTRYYITSRKDGQWASLSGNNGQFEGLLSIDSEQFDLMFDESTKNHYTIRLAQPSKRTYEGGKCGVTDGMKRLPTDESPDTKPFTRPRSMPVRPTSENYYVELVLINDYRMYSHHFKSLPRLLEYNYRLINAVNALFSDLGVHVSLKAIETWTTGERVTGTDLLSRMKALAIYSSDNYLEKHQYDASFGLVGTNYPPGSETYVLGIAWSESVCTQYATGVAMYEDVNGRIFPFRDLVVVTAHEIGHTLGLIHINRTHLQCSCPNNAQGFCIMDAIKADTSEWSNCSKKIIKDRADSGDNWCIFEKPDMYKPMPIEPICGNGIVERGETCDCGPNVDCRKCCDMAFCRMFVGSNYTCSSGPCCVNCGFKVAGVPCQSERSGIDQVCTMGSTCTGFLSSCPDSSIRADGAVCRTTAGVSSYCYNGQCNSRNDQCKAVFGSNITTGSCPDSDYSINVLGAEAGHCGEVPLKSKRYVKCNQADILCGQLMCLVKRADERAAITHAFLLGVHEHFRSTQVDAQLNHCLSINYLATTRGLITNGAVCGTDRVCFNQKCVPITGCPENCNGNGICLNNQKCLCNPGFLQPYCYPTCPENCRNRGVCRKDGTCDCSDGFYPPTCTIRKPIPPESESNASAYVTAAIVVMLLTVLVLGVLGILKYRREKDDRLAVHYKQIV